MLAGLAAPLLAPGSALGQWINRYLLAYWIVCTFVVSLAQMALHALGLPSARRKKRAR